eukprot:462345-Hanusia_phi.AAC.3
MMRERAKRARPPPAIRKQVRTLVAIESPEAIEGRRLISSPRSLEACLRCGLEPQQLLSRSLESFAEVGVSRVRQKMRYEHEREQRDDRVRRVQRMRRRLEGAKPCAGHAADVSIHPADAVEESFAADSRRAMSCDSTSSFKDSSESSIRFFDVHSRSSSSPYVAKFRSVLSLSNAAADASADVSMEVSRRRNRTAKELRAAMAAERTRAELEKHIREKIMSKEEALRRKQQEQRLFRFQVIQHRDAKLNARRAAILVEQRRRREQLAEEEAERKRITAKKLEEERLMRLAQNRIKQELARAKMAEQERQRQLKEEARKQQQQQQREALESKARARDELRRRQLLQERERRREEERTRQLRMQTAQDTREEEEARKKNVLEERRAEEERKLERLEELKREALWKRRQEKL